MTQQITLYELFQAEILTDDKLFEIGKTRNLEKIIIIDDGSKKEVQVYYNKMFTKTFKF